MRPRCATGSLSTCTAASSSSRSGATNIAGAPPREAYSARLRSASSSTRKTLPRIAPSVGQPAVRTASRRLAWSLRSCAGSNSCASAKTARISASSASNAAASKGSDGTAPAPTGPSFAFIADHDRRVPRMRLRPVAHLFQALHEAHARAAEIDVVQVHDLEARRTHARLVVGRPRRRRVAAAMRARRLHQPAAVRVVVDVQLQHAHALLQLLRERGMGIVEAVGAGGVHRAMRGQFAGRHRLLVAVVRADELDRVQRQAVHRRARARRRSRRTLQVAGDGIARRRPQQCDQRERDACTDRLRTRPIRTGTSRPGGTNGPAPGAPGRCWRRRRRSAVRLRADCLRSGPASCRCCRRSRTPTTAA